MTILAKRLKEARLNAKLTQERLGILAGIDEASASSRMNHYEKGKHAPDYSIVKKIAEVLGVPASYFYVEDDELAGLILIFTKLPKEEREKAIGIVKSFLG